MLVRARSSIHLADTKFDTKFERPNTEAMRERMNMLVLDWRRRLYFYRTSYAIFIPPGSNGHLRAGNLHLPKT